MNLSSFRETNIQSLALEKRGCAFAGFKSSPTPIPTVVISLGGLGAETLNTLKGKYTRDIGECDHIWFRMIDSDEATLDDYCKERHGGMWNNSPDAHMESGEMIHLYDQRLRSCLAPAVIPPYIDKWLNPVLKGREIRPDGAQMTRQIGRAMLVHDSVYSRVSQNLETILNEATKAARRGEVHVILIAGVSGGTGSGSLIDVAYMIHHWMRRHGRTHYNLAGYIFTPDAQFTVPGIAANPMNRANLERNGYAALKEIDYFMNIEETGGVYRLQLMDRTIECTRNIFDSCTLVSGYNESGRLRQKADIISCLTDHLLDMLTDIMDSYTDDQISEYIMRKLNRYYNKQWLEEHPERRLYHRYAPHEYQVLSYNSISVPRDELFAYCVDRIYEGVLNEFKNFHNINKQMLRKVFDEAHIGSPDDLINYTEEFWKVNRNISLDGYSKKMVRNNPMIAYDDACQVADSEAERITGAVMGRLEEDIYDNLKKQIDQVFGKYGPYVAMRAIQHEWKCKTDGDPNEPFHGVFEQLIAASEYMVKTANQCRQAVDKETIQSKAYSATRMGIIIGGATEADMTAYVSECCRQAVKQCIDPVFFDALSKVLINVAARINDYNSELFSVYTAILDEVQYILSKDGDYFSRGLVTGTEKLYQVDLINSNPERANRLQHYLDEFIFQVSAQDIAQLFIKSMRDNKEKWLGQQNEENFDVAGEVRAIMDGCLTRSNMVPQSIGKFIVAAFHPYPLSPAELDAIWLNNTPGGPKWQALDAAANYICRRLEGVAGAMAHSAGVIPLDEYEKKYFVSGLQDTNLKATLVNFVYAKTQYRHYISESISINKFIFTVRYTVLPLYVLRGMGEYNEQYVRNPAPGMHMDERGQDWRRIQNPYTIDSVALDLEKYGKDFDEIYKYPDRVILDEVEKQTRYGLQVGYVKVKQIPWKSTGLTLCDISAVPDDMELFKQELYNEALDAYSQTNKVDLIPFMERHGFILNQVFVSAGNTDVDLSLIDFEQASAADKETKYKNVPVPVEDVYKWLRKSIRYMDILEKDYKLFNGFEEILKKAESNVENRFKYRRDIETFALALKTGLVRRKYNDWNMWEYMDRNKPVTVDLRVRRRFDRKFFLYHVFAEFQKMRKESLDELNYEAKQRFMRGKMADAKEIDFVIRHIKEMLEDDCLGDRFNLRIINKEAITESDVDNYQVTDETENAGNPFLVLRRFYTCIMCLKLWEKTS